jgi:hypothetical protein
MSRVMRAVSSIGSSSREISNGSLKRIRWRPSGRRCAKQETATAFVRTASFAGPIGVRAGVLKNGTFALSVRMF